jgi:hypothetical protein
MFECLNGTVRTWYKITDAVMRLASTKSTVWNPEDEGVEVLDPLGFNETGSRVLSAGSEPRA